MRGHWGIVLIVATSCFDPRIEAGGPCTTACPGDLSCFQGTCVRDLPAPDAAEVPVDAPIDAAACISACIGDDLVCGMQSMTCELGCSASGAAHCEKVAPSNGADWTMAGPAMLALDGPLHLDTGTGELRDIDGDVVLRPAGTGTIDDITFTIVDGVAVFGVRGLTLAADADLRVEGPNPIILLVDGDAMIAGLIDASGGCTGARACAGPGGGAGGRNGVNAAGSGAGANGGMNANNHGNGGGGGGFGQAGAESAGNEAPGTTYGSAALQPLIGGSGGGHGGTADGGDGGGGGGALQITASGSITITATGAVDAGGGGGGGELSYDSGGGGGGGSGGALLLEAITVTIDGSLTANGGGGGGHTQMPLSQGTGEDGRLTATPAAGAPDSWGGGQGGTGAIAPTGGRQPDNHGGGGGGGAGRIRINASSIDGGGIRSPTGTTGAVDSI